VRLLDQLRCLVDQFLRSTISSEVLRESACTRRVGSAEGSPGVIFGELGLPSLCDRWPNGGNEQDSGRTRPPGKALCPPEGGPRSRRPQKIAKGGEQSFRACPPHAEESVWACRCGRWRRCVDASHCGADRVGGRVLAVRGAFIEQFPDFARPASTDRSSSRAGLLFVPVGAGERAWRGKRDPC
jgi:hypothetical protein